MTMKEVFERLQAMHMSMQTLVRFGTIPPLLIRFFQRPEWSYGAGKEDWADGNVYPSFGISFLPIGVASYLDLTCIFILCGAVWLEMRPYNRISIYPFYGRR